MPEQRCGSVVAQAVFMVFKALSWQRQKRVVEKAVSGSRITFSLQCWEIMFQNSQALASS